MVFEDPAIIAMNVSHYRALLKLDMADEQRSQIKRLLAQASEELVMSRGPRKPPN